MSQNKKSPDLDTVRHSIAHVMASAVQELYPGTKLAIGPTTEDGFYYDMDIPTPLTEEDLGKIEKKMQSIIDQNVTFDQDAWEKEEALDFFKKRDEIYKCEIIEQIEGEKVGIYKTGDFIDLCRGPHIENTKQIKAFKLISIAGAYWRGSEKNKMLQRIYGVAFNSPKELKQYLFRIEEAKKRDHRKVGKELELFDFNDQIGSGLVLWYPKGATLKNLIEDYWRKKHIEAGYSLVSTPHLGKADLWEASGHLENYEESMYAPMSIEEQDYYIKPMNCPFHIAIYKSKWHSYRELPVKYAELGTVYRRELSGVLHGLLRVRGFTQDDAHIICTPEQVVDEVRKTIELAIDMLGKFGFKDFEIFVSTKPDENAIGEDSKWEHATDALKKALDAKKLSYDIDEGGGAFYGPKIDLKIKDALGRSWQCSTIQFDFNLPERFSMFYKGADGAEHQPYMIHRALLGSVERFVGVLVEHYNGAFPIWIAPVQLKVISLSEKFNDQVEAIYQKFLEADVRAEIDLRSEKVGYKIREAEKQKIPYMVVIGENEINENVLALRERGRKDLGKKTFEDVLNLITNPTE